MIFILLHFKQFLFFKGTLTRFELKFFKIYFLMSRILNMDVFNALTKCESLISSYKRVKEVRILCSVNKARVLFCLHMYCIGTDLNQMLLFVVDNIINEHIESVYLGFANDFVKEIVISVLYIICKQI